MQLSRRIVAPFREGTGNEQRWSTIGRVEEPARRPQEFLAANKIETLSIVDVRKTPLRWNDVLKLIREVDEIYVAKGKVVHIDIRSDNPEPDMRVRLLLRPRGNLRA